MADDIIKSTVSTFLRFGLQFLSATFNITEEGK